MAFNLRLAIQSNKIERKRKRNRKKIKLKNDTQYTLTDCFIWLPTVRSKSNRIETLTISSCMKPFRMILLDVRVCVCVYRFFPSLHTDQQTNENFERKRIKPHAQYTYTLTKWILHHSWVFLCERVSMSKVYTHCGLMNSYIRNVMLFVRETAFRMNCWRMKMRRAYKWTWKNGSKRDS